MTTLYIGNLPANVTKERVADLVGRHTEVLDTRLVTDRRGSDFRRYAFVEVSDERLGRIISVLNGCLLEGAELRVSAARPRADRQGQAPASA